MFVVGSNLLRVMAWLARCALDEATVYFMLYINYTPLIVASLTKVQFPRGIKKGELKISPPF